jgi:pyruvate/2-oxoglutarate dehydrogenase complex dihydrolipoamide acyltransferase (E2) component
VSGVAREVVMPRLGWSGETGKLVEWLKQDGDAVKAGEIICTVEGDKANVEVETMDSGILRIPPDSPSAGAEVPVGTLMAYIVEPGNPTSPPVATRAGEQTAAVQPATEPPSDATGRIATTVTPADAMHGGTFTITNLGPYAIDAFTPIINLPECAILGVGRIRARPVVIDEATEQIAVRRMLALSLTFDHRLVDGAPAARFLQQVKQYVERPTLWLVR